MINKILKDVDAYIRKNQLTVRMSGEVFCVDPVVLWRVRNGKSGCSYKTLLVLERRLKELKKGNKENVQTGRA